MSISDDTIITHYDNTERYCRLQQDHAMTVWEPVNYNINIEFITNIAVEINRKYPPHPFCVQRRFYDVDFGVGTVGDRNDVKRIDVYELRTGEYPHWPKLLVSVDETLGEEWTKELSEKIDFDVFKITGPSKKWGEFGSKKITVLTEDLFVRDDEDWQNIEAAQFTDVQQMSYVDYEAVQTVQILQEQINGETIRHNYIEPPRYPY